MKFRNIIVTFIILGVLGGVGWWLVHREPPPVSAPVVEPPPVTRPVETAAQREERWRQEAQTAFAKAITNTFPGYKRTVRIEENIVANQPVTNWSANAVVEYVDQHGEFGRTTLFWRFDTKADSVRIIPVRY